MLDALLGDNDAPTDLERQIRGLLEALHAEPAKAEHIVKLLPLALQYVLLHPDILGNAAIPPTDARFKAHQFCHRCATQRALEDPARPAEQRFRFLLQTCMLRMLSYKVKRSIEIWLQGLAKTIFDCIDCYKGYLRAKQQLGPNFLYTYEPDRIDHFLGFILEWEERSAIVIIDDSNVSGESSKVPLSTEQTYSIFDVAGALKSKNKTDGLYEKMRRGRKYIALNKVPEAPSGLLAFAVDEEEPVRVWAEMQWTVPPMSRESSTESKTVGNLVRQAIETRQWNGFNFIVKMAPEAFSGGALANTLLAHLSPSADTSAGILTSLKRLLEERGTALWASEDRELPLVLLSTILDNGVFVQCLSDNAERMELWSWIDTWIKSLKDRLLSQHDSDKIADADAKVYEETLKRLAHFLLERFQQGGHRDAAKHAAIRQAVTMLQNCIADAAEEKTSKHIWEAIVRVASLHATTIARKAFTKEATSTLSGMISTEISSKAQALIESIFHHDCIAFSESILTLSEVTSASQTAYKRATRPKVTQEGTKSMDETEMAKAVSEALEKTRDRLNIDPLVCSELWKASYSAVRSGSGIQVFLRPLQKIAALVEPQINSHIVIVKERHGSLPAYVQYKERLKSVILVHSRRISAMRGNLPSLLLEASEISSTQSSQVASSDPTTICYKYADGILAANLCPQQDVYKAAQNIVRAAFEDAESRGDCFRSLLQCNPLLSLQGINSFLTEFLTAAARLVEANDAAKWMVRSFSDVLDALCSETDGLLRQGVPGCLLERTDILTQIRKELRRMWTSMCKSIAVIFKRTPHWARVLPHAELTAWFRDVSLFAREALAELHVFREALTWGLDAKDKSAAQAPIDMLNDLALPLEEASSWLRMNNAEIVQETREYFVKGLQTFKSSDMELPDGAKRRMLEFIDAQSKITKDEDRMTLLSLDELRELRHLLDPRSEPVEILDSDDETNDSGSDRPLMDQTKKQQSKSSEMKKEPARSSDDGKTDAFSVLLKAQSLSGALKAKQSKLSFSSVDAKEAMSKPFVSKAAPTPPPPRTVGASGAANKYQGASARVAVPARPSGKLAQLRQDFNANAYRPSLPTKSIHGASRELPEPAAPEAKRSFAPGQMVGSNGHTAGKAPQDAQSSDDSDSSDDEPKVGLAEMGHKKKSPVKMRTKPRFVPHQPAQRRTIMIDNIEARRAQREREEAERKRKLREPVNLNPLHRKILSWRYWADGERPPVTPEAPAPTYETLRNTYTSPEEYQSILEPMLQLECWAELQASKEQIARGNQDYAPLTATVNGRSNTDGFVVLSMTLAEDRRLQGPPIYQDTDVLFVRSSEKGEGGRKKTVLGKVQAFKNDPKGPRLTLRCSLAADNQQMTSVLVSNSIVEIGKLFSLVTLHRAYEALQAVPYFDLLPNILLARAAVRETVTSAEIQEAEKSFGVNPPQAEAICSAIKAEQGFHLIQGPPGTGKTKTIASLVAHFMRTRKAPAVPIRAANANASSNPLAGAPIKQKILLVAPSNAAVDEVARRAQSEVKLADGRVLRPSVVRLGREAAISAAVKDISLDSIVERRIGTNASSDGPTVDPAQLHQEIRMLKDQRDHKRAQIEVARQEGQSEQIIAQFEAEMRNLTSKRMDVMSKLDEAKDKKQTMTRQYDADRRRIQQEVLMQADVVCATLGGAGHPSLSSLPLDFETVIIDEAAQAVELDALIPLRYGCKKCIMVGDPNQLPPTVISREAERLKYSRSLFVRIFDNPKNLSHLLSIQYRMHPRISAFPNVAFYDGRLQDGPGMDDLNARPWHKDPLLGPLRFVNSRHGSENVGRGGLSFTNRSEAELAAAIFERLHREARRTRLGIQAVEGKIGVVTMYKEQVFELRRTFQRVFGSALAETVDFNTVDGFQGQEKDIIILSCVRTNGIGFLNDFRRINVAITRAKCNLFVIGDVVNLERNDRDGFWRRSIEAARKNGDLITASVDDFRRQYVPTSPGPPPGPPPAPPPNVRADVHPADLTGTSEQRPSTDHQQRGEKRSHADGDGEARRKKKKRNRSRNDRSTTLEDGEIREDQSSSRRDSTQSTSSRSSSEASHRNGKTQHRASTSTHGHAPQPSRPEGTDDRAAKPPRPPRPPPARNDVRPPHLSANHTAVPGRPQATRLAIPGEDEAPPANRGRPRPRPPLSFSGPNAAGAINPRAVAASRPPPRPRPPPTGRPEYRPRDEGPSDRAKASLFIPRRPAPSAGRPPRPRPY